MFEHLLDEIDTDDPFTPPIDTGKQLVASFLSPSVPHTQTSDEINRIKVRMEVYNHELPFDLEAKRRILSNMLFEEAFTAVKGSDRLKAVELLGKTEGVSLFAPEKQTIEVKGLEELREQLATKLGALLEGEWENITDV